MSEEPRPNIYTEEWQRAMEHRGFAVRGTRVGAMAGATQLGITVGIEEVVVALEGTPTPRSPEGERLDYFEGEPE